MQLKLLFLKSFVGVEFLLGQPISIVMDQINGENLDTLLKRKLALSESAVRLYANQMLDAIIYMHSLDVIHRDIKSSNIMIVKGKFVKLIDFGMAKKADSSAYSRQSDNSETVVGTLPYMV